MHRQRIRSTNLILLSPARSSNIPPLLWRIPANVVPIFHAACAAKPFGNQAMESRSSFTRSLLIAVAFAPLCGGCMFARGAKHKEETAATPAADPAKTAEKAPTNATPAELAAILSEVQQ